MKLTNYIRQAFVAAAMQDVPSINYNQQASDLANKVMREALQAKLGKVTIEEMGGWLNRCVVDTPYGLDNIYAHSPSYSFLQVSLPETWTELEALAAKSKSQSEERSALESKLRGLAASATTRKALVAMLPEFEKYLPDDTPAVLRTLPAIANVMSDFVKAGWPKGTVGAAA